MKIFSKYTICAALAGLFCSCTGNFEEYNTNPNQPQTLESGALVTQLINCLASPEENPCQRNNTFWACFGGYVTATNTWHWGDFNYYTYNVGDKENRWSADWYFTQFYKNYFSIVRMNQPACLPLAKLLRVDVMLRVACLQGPIPYTQIKEGTFAVAYDNEETAFKAMFEDLDSAIAELTEIAGAMTDEINPLKGGYDPIYDGDFKKWVKYANSLKLRMAIRISGVSGYEEFAHQKALEAVNHSIGVMSSINDSAWDNLNGRYKNGFQVVQEWGEVRPNASIVTFMNGYNDARRSVYFTPKDGSSSEYVGVRSGIRGIKPDMYRKSSKFNVETNTKMLVFSAAEVAFLRAEANLLGWDDVADNAQRYYEEGIRLSFNERGVGTAASAYINDSSSVPTGFKDMKNTKYDYTPKNTVTIKWNEGASTSEKLNRIITQKWIANFPMGNEGWNDYRRTGFPDIFPAGDNLSTTGVTSERGQRRLRFSQTEYETNKANVQAAVAMIGSDKENIDLWWAKKN